MSNIEYSTALPFSVSSLPLVKLYEAEYLIPLLAFTAHEALSCVADALMDHFIIEEIHRSGCDYATALAFLQGLIH